MSNLDKPMYDHALRLRADAHRASKEFEAIATQIAELLTNEIGIDITSMTDALVYYSYLDDEGTREEGSFPAEWLWDKEWAEILEAKRVEDEAAKKKRDAELADRIKKNSDDVQYKILAALKKRYLKR